MLPLHLYTWMLLSPLLCRRILQFFYFSRVEYSSLLVIFNASLPVLLLRCTWVFSCKHWSNNVLKIFRTNFILFCRILVQYWKVCPLSASFFSLSDTCSQPALKIFGLFFPERPLLHPLLPLFCFFTSRLICATSSWPRISSFLGVQTFMCLLMTIFSSISWILDFHFTYQTFRHSHLSVGLLAWRLVLQPTW